MVRSDCFANGVNDRCSATSNEDCEGCAFFKTREQFKDDFMVAKKKMESEGTYNYFKNEYPLLGEMAKKIGG